VTLSGEFRKKGQEAQKAGRGANEKKERIAGTDRTPEGIKQSNPACQL
jgi:hypothetical protein